jgi:hypothetical protein
MIYSMVDRVDDNKLVGQDSFGKENVHDAFIKGCLTQGT